MTLARWSLCIAAAATLAAAPAPARAALIVTAVEVGGDVVLTGSGSLDLTGAGTPGLFLAHRALASSRFFWVGGEMDLNNPADAYTGFFVVGPGSYGAGATIYATGGSGDIFGIDFDNDIVIVPVDYVFGTPLSGSTTYGGQTFASLGMAEGSYVWTFPSDSITLNVVVPEPGTGLILGLGLLALAGRPRSLRGSSDPEKPARSTQAGLSRR